MNAFARDWLALREPADHAARSARLDASAAGLVPEGGGIVDLGAGAGSNLRALAPLVPHPHTWLLVDKDEALLAHAAPPPGVTLERRVHDLAVLPAIAGAALVTASALLDLVSADWLARLAAACASGATPFHAALTYDGAVAFAPVHPLDAIMRDAVNRHQRRHKGLGAALGPDAAQAARRAFEAEGYQIEIADTPWRLGPDSAALQRAFVEGWAQAAAESMEFPRREILAWSRFRLDAAAGGSLTVGHRDLLAVRN